VLDIFGCPPSPASKSPGSDPAPGASSTGAATRGSIGHAAPRGPTCTRRSASNLRRGRLDARLPRGRAQAEAWSPCWRLPAPPDPVEPGGPVLRDGPSVAEALDLPIDRWASWPRDTAPRRSTCSPDGRGDGRAVHPRRHRAELLDELGPSCPPRPLQLRLLKGEVWVVRPPAMPSRSSTPPPGPRRDPVPAPIVGRRRATAPPRRGDRPDRGRPTATLTPDDRPLASTGFPTAPSGSSAGYDVEARTITLRYALDDRTEFTRPSLRDHRARRDPAGRPVSVRAACSTCTSRGHQLLKTAAPAQVVVEVSRSRSGARALHAVRRGLASSPSPTDWRTSAVAVVAVGVRPAPAAPPGRSAGPPGAMAGARTRWPHESVGTSPRLFAVNPHRWSWSWRRGGLDVVVVRRRLDPGWPTHTAGALNGTSHHRIVSLIASWAFVHGYDTVAMAWRVGQRGDRHRGRCGGSTTSIEEPRVRAPPGRPGAPNVAPTDVRVGAPAYSELASPGRSPAHAPRDLLQLYPPTAGADAADRWCGHCPSAGSSD